MNALTLSGGSLSPPSSLTSIAFGSIGGATLKAYRSDWQHLANALGKPDAESAARALVEAGQGETTRVLLEYRQMMIDEGDAPASINRRLCAVRFLFTALRRVAVIGWTIEIAGVPVQTIRDTRGPREDTFTKMLESVQGKPDCILLLRLMRDMGLRRQEVQRLTLEDVQTDGETTRLLVKGKGKLEKTALTMPRETVAALRDWLSVRGGDPGSLLGMSYQRIERVVNRAGYAAGVRVTPHGLRHAAITRAALLTNGNAPVVQQFARHRDISTTMRYIDDYADTYGKVAQMVAGGEGK